MKRKLANLLIGGLTLTLVYVGSYCIMSVGGRYEAEAYGIKFDESGDAKLTPKKLTKGPSWYPFNVYTTDGSLSTAAIVYFPILMFDRLFWHNESYAGLESQS